MASEILTQAGKKRRDESRRGRHECPRHEILTLAGKKRRDESRRGRHECPRHEGATRAGKKHEALLVFPADDIGI
jgi:hypothetical protein